MLKGIKSTQIEQAWGEIWPILKRAVAKSQNDYSEKDIKEALLDRNMQLWAWTVGEKIEAVCVTQIINYPQKRVCQIVFVAGSNLKEWLNEDNKIAIWARENGCVQLEGHMRDGWLRVLKNWKKCCVIMRRDI